MPGKSSGLLMYRVREEKIEVLLVHPGGPFWIKKDNGAWSIPKGEYQDDEDPLSAARREFTEETGFTAEGEFLELRPIKQKGGKTVIAWAVEGDLDASAIKSNTFIIEWPPKSGKMAEFPEADQAGWFSLDAAIVKINQAQAAFLEELVSILKR